MGHLLPQEVIDMLPQEVIDYNNWWQEAVYVPNYRANNHFLHSIGLGFLAPPFIDATM